MLAQYYLEFESRKENEAALMQYLKSVESKILRKVKSLNTALNRIPNSPPIEKNQENLESLPKKKLKVREDASTRITENGASVAAQARLLPLLNLDNLVLPEVRRKKKERSSSVHLGKRVIGELNTAEPLCNGSDSTLGGSVMFQMTSQLFKGSGSRSILGSGLSTDAIGA